MPAPIPILFLITDLDLGGSPLMLRTLAAGLRARGVFAPTVANLASGGEVARMIRKDGVPVVGLGGVGARDLPAVLRRWAGLLWYIRPRVVQSMLIHANLVATLGQPFGPSGVSYLQSLHTMQDRPRWHWYLQGLIAARSSGFLAPNDAILRRLERFGAVERGFVVPNGIDLARFRDALPPENRPWPSSAAVIGYVGRFDPVKRLDVLVEAFRQLLLRNPLQSRDLHLALVGYGRQEPALRALVGQSGLAARVHFLGPRQNVEQWYKSFQILCLPSLAEGFGLTVVEAMAASIPVVTMDTPVLRQVTGGHAALVSDPSAQSLSFALQEVISDPAAAHQRSLAAQAHVAAHYSAEAMIIAYEKILKKFATP